MFLQKGLKIPWKSWHLKKSCISKTCVATWNPLFRKQGKQSHNKTKDFGRKAWEFRVFSMNPTGMPDNALYVLHKRYAETSKESRRDYVRKCWELLQHLWIPYQKHMLRIKNTRCASKNIKNRHVSKKCIKKMHVSKNVSKNVSENIKTYQNASKRIKNNFTQHMVCANTSK